MDSTLAATQVGYACRCVDMLKFMASKETAGAKSAQAVGA
jgi:hypothetical protein